MTLKAEKWLTILKTVIRITAAFKAGVFNRSAVVKLKTTHEITPINLTLTIPIPTGDRAVVKATKRIMVNGLTTVQIYFNRIVYPRILIIVIAVTVIIVRKELN